MIIESLYNKNILFIRVIFVVVNFELKIEISVSKLLILRICI